MGSHRKKLKNFWERVTSSYSESLPDIIGYLEEIFGSLDGIECNGEIFTMDVVYPELIFGSNPVSITHCGSLVLLFGLTTFVFFY
jgi:hypothetical protein